MNASVKWAIGVAVVFAAVVGLAASLSLFPFEREIDPEPPTSIPGIADGEWFAWVIVGKDETGAKTIGVDLAEMLSGEEARRAAVEDGVISEGEDLPNDFYIDNPEKTYELLRMADGGQISVVAGDDVSKMISIDADQLAALYEGTYAGAPVYGIAPNQPIAMDVVVVDGLITSASAVYLP